MRVLSGAASVAALMLSAGAACAAAAPAAPAPSQAPPKGTKQVSEVVVTASRRNLIGVAQTASQGSITKLELDLRPVYRVGQLLETTPGLVVTAHSGEGKANQYLLRGFNLDHGTDIANFVDDMPVNRPTNTHGQGYSDVNYLIPQIAAGLDFTKGPYYAAVGDFGAVASTHVRLLNDIPTQLSVSAGTLGDQEVYAGGTREFSMDDRLLGAVYFNHLDGPWTHPDDFRKFNAALRYSHGDAMDGFNLTGMYYRSSGNFTTDQPLRAVQEGLIDRFGTLDPSDGSRSERYSLSGHYAHSGDLWSVKANAYAIRSTMTLWNDFTHFLDDPVNGDQEAQNERRTTLGGALSATRLHNLGRFPSETTAGIQLRYDDNYVDRQHTLRRQVLDYCEAEQPEGPALPVPAVNGACTADQTHLLDLGLYAENTTHWNGWLRTIVGLREEYYQASDHSLVTGFEGSAHQWLIQPKASIVLGPWLHTELYVSAGRGFHSDDVRGVFGTVPLEGVPQNAGRTPLLAPATGEEVGLRSDLFPRLNVQVAVFREDFRSELAYDAEAGQDSASAPSRRQGIEVSAEYRPVRWLELNTDLAFSKARYQGDLAAFGLDGPYIANAPSFIGSFGVLVDNLGPWFGGLQWRRLGAYPISDGDARPKDPGYSEWNLDVGYKLSRRLSLQVSVYNLFNSHANAAAYYYASRLPGEPAEGITGFQVHPLEPISARFKVTATF